MVTTLHSAPLSDEFHKKSLVRLLVSVRDIVEAEIAIDANVDWLDVKDPSQGPLGRPDLDVAIAIERLAFQKSPGLRVSVALGESRDSTIASLVTYTRSFKNTTSFKLAFSNSHPFDSSVVKSLNPQKGWCWLFRELASGLPEGHLIPVFYADRKNALAPDWESILKLAVEASSRRILIDTFYKDGRSLTDHMDLEQLRRTVCLANQHGIDVAIAGSLRKFAIPSLMTVGADMIGVRGAACKGGNRTDSIDSATLQELASILKSTDSGAMEP